jgi:hypothetical protein
VARLSISRAAGIVVLALTAACSSSAPGASASERDASAPGDAAPAEGGPLNDGGALAEGGAVSVPIKISGDGTQGKILLVPISINGGPPFDVLVDTGSVGLRVFKASLGGTSVTTSAQAISVEFGSGVFAGHKATGSVSFGGVTTPSDTAFQLVESYSCGASNPMCDLASGTPKALTDLGAHGVMGIALRKDLDGLMSPFASLAAPRSDGFTIRTGGLSSSAGEIVLGPGNLSSAAQIPLVPAGTQPNGMPAWADDAVPLCFEINGMATEPACTASTFDTGSNFDVLYAKGVAPALVTTDGNLASGVAFGASHSGSGFRLKFTVGSPVSVSKDGVIVQDTDPFTILGLEVFLRNDVAFDRVGGRIGLQPL